MNEATRCSVIELLEPRIAPAAVFTFTDVDGDAVKVTSSVGTKEMLTSAVKLVQGPAGSGLAELSLGSAFTGAKISITAKLGENSSGDGSVHVGRINATGVDLKSVVVDGDLGAIDVGDAKKGPVALRSLTVHSLGVYGTSTGSPDLRSDIEGGIGRMLVKTDIRGASVHITEFTRPPAPGGNSGGSSGTITVLGSLIGGETLDSGTLFAAVRTIFIGGDVEGGEGPGSGSIHAERQITRILVRGSVIGSSGESSGRIDVGSGQTSVEIFGDVRGGAGASSGSIGGEYIAPLWIHGSLIGGTNNSSGSINVDFLDLAVVGRDVVGGSVASGTLFETGSIRAEYIGGLSVGGSIIAGVQGAGADLRASGAIRAEYIDRLFVGGSLIGNSTERVYVVTGGSVTFGGEDGAFPTTLIGDLTIRGRVESADILAGFTSSGGSLEYSPTGRVAGFGRVHVGGDWIGSNLIASASPGPNGQFGDGDDFFDAPSRVPGTLATIGSINIEGQVAGTARSGDHFGFVAELIGSFRLGGTRIPLSDGPSNDNRPLGITGDVRLREV